MEKIFDLPGQFMLLCMDPSTGKTRPAWYNFSYGLAGAVLLELGLREHIFLRHGWIGVKDQRQTGETILDDARKAIQDSRRKKRPGQWLIRFSYKSRRYRKMLTAEWEKRGVARISSRKILGIWANDEVKLRDPGIQQKLVDHVLQVVARLAEPEDRDLALLVLIDAGKLHHIISNDPLLKQRVKSLLDDKLSQGKCQSRHLTLIWEVRNVVKSAITSAIGLQSSG